MKTKTEIIAAIEHELAAARVRREAARYNPDPDDYSVAHGEAIGIAMARSIIRRGLADEN